MAARRIKHVNVRTEVCGLEEESNHVLYTVRLMIANNQNKWLIYVTNRKSVRRVHHPSRELWCQRQQSAPCPTAEEAPAAKKKSKP